MRNETRVGVVVGLLVVVITSVYFYGSSREDEDVLVGLGRRGAAQPSANDLGIALKPPVTASTAVPSSETMRTPSGGTPALYATGNAAPPRSISPPVQPPPKPDESLLVDAMRPRRNELPPLTPSPVPLRSGSSSALEDATRRNLESSTEPEATPVRADLTAIGERIRNNDAANAVRVQPVSPVDNGLTSSPPITEPIDLDAGEEPLANPLVNPPIPAWPKQHRVEYGQTLYGISMQYYGRSSGTDAILKANPGLKGPRHLREGQVLVIPALAGALTTAATPPGPATPARTAAAPGRNTYVVREGDSFYTIANNLLGDGKRWEEIFQMNKSLVKGNPKRLRAGMTLVMPPPKP